MISNEFCTEIGLLMIEAMSVPVESSNSLSFVEKYHYQSEEHIE